MWWLSRLAESDVVGDWMVSEELSCAAQQAGPAQRAQAGQDLHPLRAHARGKRWTECLKRQPGGQDAPEATLERQDAREGRPTARAEEPN